MALNPYKLRIENRKDYLFAHVEADELSLEIAHGYLSEVAEASRSLGLDKVLVLRDIPAVFPDSGQFGIAQDALEMLRGIKVCWVNPHAANQPGLDFAALVAGNRGAIFKIFTNESDAAAWLMDDQDVS
ncbi:MAG: hypothetical protein ABJA02_04020 [Acidobacteriota bacterium]